ncbi:MAG: T9SS type A sorting domain-containing protein [Saprospiraceae bacterium]|nr:T9SS type A sorting domain-containing protein [Saprospiraceae bacterium]
MTILIEVLKAAQLSDLITLNSRVTPTIAYYEKGSKSGVALEFVGMNEDEIKLYQNEPNPANTETTIRFQLPEAMSAKINFYDVTGKLLKEISGDYKKGSNSINLSVSELSAKGLIYYELKTENEKVGRKMIIH